MLAILTKLGVRILALSTVFNVVFGTVAALVCVVFLIWNSLRKDE